MGAGGPQKDTHVSSPASNLQSYKRAVLLNKRKVSTREWRNFVIENWDSLTEDLKDATILWLAGRHGLETGRIKSKDEKAPDWNKQSVMSNKFNPNSKDL